MMGSERIIFVLLILQLYIPFFVAGAGASGRSVIQTITSKSAGEVSLLTGNSSVFGRSDLYTLNSDVIGIGKGKVFPGIAETNDGRIAIPYGLGGYQEGTLKFKDHRRDIKATLYTGVCSGFRCEDIWSTQRSTMKGVDGASAVNPWVYVKNRIMDANYSSSSVPMGSAASWCIGRKITTLENRGCLSRKGKPASLKECVVCNTTLTDFQGRRIPLQFFTTPVLTQMDEDERIRLSISNAVHWETTKRLTPTVLEDGDPKPKFFENAGMVNGGDSSSITSDDDDIRMADIESGQEGITTGWRFIHENYASALHQLYERERDLLSNAIIEQSQRRKDLVFQEAPERVSLVDLSLAVVGTLSLETVRSVVENVTGLPAILATIASLSTLIPTYILFTFEMNYKRWVGFATETRSFVRLVDPIRRDMNNGLVAVIIVSVKGTNSDDRLFAVILTLTFQLALITLPFVFKTMLPRRKDRLHPRKFERRGTV